MSGGLNGFASGFCTLLRGVEDCAAGFCALRRLNGVALSKIYEITRPDFVEFKSPRRAFLQFLHPNPIQSPLAGLYSVPLCAAVSRFFETLLLSKK
jgi:hypothetical protein